MMAGAGSSEKLKVFISYSRRDSSEFAEELIAALELAGFAPFLDRHDIAAGEDWEARLGALIEAADTVVFVISPEAMKSERCAWEVDKARAQGKRVLPVIWINVPVSEIPEELRRRQFVQFDKSFGIARPLGQLAAALRQDIDWIREHTRLSDLAARWDARNRPESLLLRGDEIVAAQAWADRRSVDAPSITEKISAFIAASRAAEAASQGKAKAALRRVRLAQAVTAVCLVAVLAGVAAWLNQDQLRERIYVWRNVNPLTAAQESALTPGQSFKECANCPDMIVVPGGSFMMGSAEGERHAHEQPQHKVTIAKPFAVSKTELTFAEWDTCWAQSRCPDTYDGGWGRDQRPVINVSWDEAKQYVAWLSKLTSKTYRLLSEAEYEYATRAGTTTTYPWGDNIKLNGQAMANCDGCGGKWGRYYTAPVGSFPPNKFGLYDMLGNIFEWTEDCWHPDYKGAPTEGSAWVDESYCTGRVIRGGSWIDSPSNLRAAARGWNSTDFRYVSQGLRVARTLAR